MSQPTSKTIQFVLEKETKNAMRYKEEGDVPIIGSLYVQKHALQAMGDPKAARVQVVLTIAGS